MDALVVAKDQELHTEVMLLLMPPHFLEHYQQQQFHYTVGVYAGKDDAKGLKDNFAPLFAELTRLEKEGFSVDGYTIIPPLIGGYTDVAV